MLLCCAMLLVRGLLGLQEPEVKARFSLAPLEVEVGEPFQLTLSVEHPSASSVYDLELAPLELDDSWVVFDASRETAVPQLTAAGQSITRWHWRLASLEAGERRLLDELISLVSDKRVSAVDASETSIAVRSLLAEAENQPRPLRGLPLGFGALEPSEPSLWQRAWPGLAAFLLLCAALAVWRFTHRPRALQAVPALPPLAELEELRARAVQEPSQIRELHFSLTRLVRRGTDEKRGLERAGLTDTEWLLELERELGALAAPMPAALDALPAALRQYLLAAEGIKYAQADASPWALEETYDATRRILESLRQCEWPQALQREVAS